MMVPQRRKMAGMRMGVGSIVVALSLVFAK
jgi:hypothetical protein